MKDEATWRTVAVLPMRMQTEDLAPDVHPGHFALVKEAAEKHRDILIVLGVPRTYELEDNPLNFEMRKEMALVAARKHFPENVFVVMPSQSRNVDYATRSKLFDEMIRAIYPCRRILIYGARDSFIDKYSGKFPVHRVETTYFGSATQLRRDMHVRHSRDFRAGIIWAKQNQPAVAFPAVDVVVADKNAGRLILVRKEDESGWRFPGALFSPDVDTSYETAAARVVAKEIPGARTTIPYILESNRLEDWRLKRSKHKIITILCFAGYSGGQFSAGSGVIDAKWFDFGEFENALVEDHWPLGEIARKHGMR